MRRREFVTLLGATAAAWPVVAPAQTVARPVIGFLHAGIAELNRHTVAAFTEGLGETGYIDGRNVIIKYRWAEGQYDRLPELAAELARSQVNVIAVGTPVAAIAAKRATSTIPIVFSIGGDPVKNGLVDSFNRPGGNVTGATFFSNLLTAKRLGLLHELVPNAKIFGALVNPESANAKFQIGEAEEAVRKIGAELTVAGATSVSELEQAFDNLKEKRVQALIILSDTVLNAQAEHVAKLALRDALPTCFAFRRSTAAGGLMSYGVDNVVSTRQAGQYVGRVLKGEKPADLPVQQPTKFEFVINMKTARALNLSIPYSMQLLADEVIE
jgi:putative ABC transport system substrate-binding protein